MALAAGSLIALPAWATGWSQTSAQPLQPFLSGSQASLLAEIAETLIPASDTPGAKALGVPGFIQKMLEDCYEKPVQEAVKSGLEAVETLANASFGNSFATGDAAQRQAVLAKMATAEEPARKEFFALVKNLTIQGYTTSEYVMTKHLHYVMAPGHYYGCVPAAVATK
ncbi:MAG: gluconate 2-dehydrogenase subunit 3 family protein [Bacteroidetes bacterium]|nr:gluconate 2-dehydrogenase subunit 3 family protein [Fibrella sp.]